LARSIALENLLAPTIDGMGYELLGVEHVSQGRHSVLRLFIDKIDGINIEDCERVSRQVSGVLDVEDPIRGEYSLEVSSPGLDRPLFKMAHFERFVGEKCAVRLKQAKDGRRKLSGVIRSTSGDGVVIELEENNCITLSLDEIEKANLVPQF